MKIEIFNVPKLSHQYTVTAIDCDEITAGNYVTTYRLGINKQLTVTTANDVVVAVEFDTGKQAIKLPRTWYKIIH